VLVLGGTLIDDAELARLRPHSSLAVGEGVNLTGDDWRRHDVQERYAGRFSPFIDARIAT
jgi:hypothetical protein